MNEYKKVRLGDVFDLQMGKTPDRNNSQYWNTTDNKWISIADISKSEKFIYETKEFISESAVKESGIKIIPKDTVIMSFKLSIGKTAITTEDCYSNEAIMAFHKKDFYEIDNNYLFHIFSNKDWSEGANKAVKGVTLNKASLSVATIPLPPIETQKQIAATLDKVTKIIVESRKLLEKYDLLIKSRFIEMFG
ncbi:MAG: restriction endonuclease subunit S, partial [Treponema sp.]|nr:restriction endonuclease subunit S [Treponema sp.]